MNNKNVTAFLIAAICLLAVGYASLTQRLTINGTSKITGTWNVHFQNEQLVSASTGVEAGTPSLIGTTQMEFSAVVKKPGDTVTYSVVVKNDGTIPAKLASVGESTTGTASDIQWSYSGVTENTTVLAAGQSAVVTVVGTFDPEATTITDGETSTYTLTLNFAQNN